MRIIGKSGFKTSGVAALALIVIVVVVVAAAGTATYYFVVVAPNPTSNSTATSLTTTTTMRGSSTTSTGKSGQTSTASSIGGSTSLESSSTSGVSSAAEFSSSSTSSLNYLLNMNDLLGNFSQMTVEYYSSSSGSSNFTYDYLGLFSVNSTTQLRELNVSVVSSSSSSSSFLLWLDSAGNVSMVTSGGQNITGSLATQVGGSFLSIFQSIFSDSTQLLSAYSSLVFVSSGTQNFGPTQLSVSSYTWTYTGYTYSINIGNIPGTSVYLLTYWYFTANGSTVGYQVLSLTRA